MSHSTNLIPSKNALRALRSLAFSHHVAFVGAVGTVSGLVAVHHQQRRKVQLAERILETKRTIHILSKGRGNAQAVRMFEAAEKGEDFTLHHGRPRKTRRTRRYSALAAQKSMDDEHVQFLPLNTTEEAKIPLPEVAQPNRQIKKYKALRKEEILTANRRHVPSSESSRGASAALAPTWTRTKFVPKMRGTWSATVAVAAKARLEKRWRLHAEKWAEGTSIPVDVHAVVHHQQEATDLHPVPQIGLRAAALDGVQIPEGLSTEESVFFNFVFGRPSPDSIFQSNFFQTIRPWSESLADGESSMPEEQDTSNREPQASFGIPGLSESLASVLPVTFVSWGRTLPLDFPGQDLIDASYTRYQDYAREKLYSTYAIQRHRYVLGTLAHARQNSELPEFLVLLERTLLAYSITQRPEDYKLIVVLIKDFSDHVGWKVLEPVIFRVVRRLLADKIPKLIAVKLLYQHSAYQLKNPQRVDVSHYVAMRYLEQYCISESDSEDQVSELRKIVIGLTRFSRPLGEQLMVPVLRSLCRAGKVSRAHAVFDEMTTEYGIEASFYSLSELMRGYAAIGAWPKVKAIMNKAHADDLIWQRFQGYSKMFSGTLEHYAATHSPEKVYNFVVHCIKEYNLVPTSLVSTRVLCVCLQARQYELVREWIAMLQRDFQDLDIGIDTSTFAHEVANTWKKMGASCEDILSGCKALATNAIRDPFSRTFRGIVSEAISRDLEQRLVAMEKVGPCRLPSYRDRKNAHALLADVQDLITKTFEIGFTPRTRLMAQDLVQQTKAVADLDLLFGGSIDIQNAKDWNEQYSPVEEKKVADDIPKMPHGLRAHRLPSVKNVITMVQKCYTSRDKAHLPVDHAVLRYVVERLSKQSRNHDACTVLETIYDSQWAQPSTGVVFDIDLFSLWLKLAYEVKSAPKVRAVLWAVVDSGPEVRIDTALVLLARIAAPKTHSSSTKKASDEEIAEVEYLRQRLRRRKWEQRDTNVLFSKWKGLNSFSNFHR